MRRKQAGCRGIGGQVGVEPQHDVGLGPGALHLQPGQQRRAIASTDQFQITGAFRLERGLDKRTRPPIGNEAVIGV